MGAKWQRVKIEIPKGYTPAERRAIAQDVVDYIVKRTQDGLNKVNRNMPGYSKEYIKSLNFKIAGKSPSKVDLTQSGDMLGALDLLSERAGEITIGYKNGTLENAVADGNIRGTYGQSKPKGPKRDFLGITKKDLLEKVLSNYPMDNRKASKQRSDINAAADNAVDTSGEDTSGE